MSKRWKRRSDCFRPTSRSLSRTFVDRLGASLLQINSPIQFDCNGIEADDLASSHPPFIRGGRFVDRREYFWSQSTDELTGHVKIRFPAVDVIHLPYPLPSKVLTVRRYIQLSMLMLISATSLLASDVAEKKVVHSQPSIGIQSDQVQLYVTETGGHMAPVTFYRDSDKPISPYHISPWQDEPTAPMPAPVLVPLRGDFFCMPFGGNGE